MCGVIDDRNFPLSVTQDWFSGKSNFSLQSFNLIALSFSVGILLQGNS